VQRNRCAIHHLPCSWQQAVYWYFWNHKSRTLGSRTYDSAKPYDSSFVKLAAYSFKYAANWSVATLWGTEGTPYK
jgi:hypothetical protein